MNKPQGPWPALVLIWLTAVSIWTLAARGIDGSPLRARCRTVSPRWVWQLYWLRACGT